MGQGWRYERCSVVKLALGLGKKFCCAHCLFVSNLLIFMLRSAPEFSESMSYRMTEELQAVRKECKVACRVCTARSE